MARHHTLKINGQIVSAEDGETLVEAALGASLLIPTDCSAGQCGCCRVTVRSGSVDAQGTQEDNTVLACQARVNGPVEIEFEPLPVPIKAAGTVSEINELSPEMIEVVGFMPYHFWW